MLYLRPIRSDSHRRFASESLICPVYKAFPIIIPAMGKWLSSSMSFREEIPPDAITGIFTADKSSLKLEILGPCSIPSFEISVKIIAQGDTFSISLANATAVHLLTDVQ